MSETLSFQSNQDIRNKAKSTGHKPPLKRKEVWAIRVRLQLAKQPRDLALFNLAIDSKLRGCDLVRLRVCDVANGNRVGSRATIVQKMTGRPVRFEITGQTRDAIASWIECAGLRDDQFLFPSRMRWSPHLSTRQYARIVKSWVMALLARSQDRGTRDLVDLKKPPINYA
jgi:integrase